jgi:hypothetical protein
VSGERAFGGAVALFVLGAAVTAYANDSPLLGTALLIVGEIGIVLTFAKWLPILHRLPRAGAIPPPEVDFHLEAPPDGMTFAMDPDEPESVLLCALIRGGRRHELTRVLVNMAVVGATKIDRTYQDGELYKDGGIRQGPPTAPYWVIPSLTIPLADFVMFFKVTIPKPGDYDVLLRLQSSDFYNRGEHAYLDMLIARSSAPPADKR